MSSSSYVPPSSDLVNSVGRGSITNITDAVSVSLAEAQINRIKADTLQSFNLESDKEAQERLNKEEEWTKKITIVVAAIGIAAVVLSLGAIYIEVGSLVVIIASIFPFICSPVAIIQRKELNKLPSLRKVMNSVRQQVNLLHIRNNKLHVLNNQLETEVSRLSLVEKELEQHCHEQQTQVDQLTNLVQENGTTIRQMKQIQESYVMMQVLDIIMASDTNEDFTINENEMDILMLRLRSIDMYKIDDNDTKGDDGNDNENGDKEMYKKVTIQNEELIREQLLQNNSIMGIFDITKNLLNEYKLQLSREAEKTNRSKGICGHRVV